MTGHLGQQGGLVTAAGADLQHLLVSLDLQFLQDLTGSFADDIVMVRGLVPQIVTALQAVQPNAEFGVSTFRDKPIGAFGGVGDWVYQQQLGLSLANLEKLV